MPTKKATVQYRYVNVSDLSDNYNLHEVVVDVLSRASADASKTVEQVVGARKKDLDQDQSYVVLNQIAHHSLGEQPMFLGELLCVRAGKEVPGLQQSLDEDVPFVEIANLTLGDQQSLVDGILYFGLVENHLAIIEGQKARSRTLERYLTRLLQDAGEMEPGESVMLNPLIEGLQARKVSKITMKPPKAVAPGSDGPEKRKKAGSQAVRDRTVIDVLRAMGVESSQIDEIQRNIPKDGWIEGLFTMVFKQKGGRKGAIDREHVETMLRNVSDHDLGLFDLEGGAEKRGSFKLSQTKNVEHDGSLLVPPKAMQAIKEMLVTWARQGKIDLTF